MSIGPTPTCSTPTPRPTCSSAAPAPAVHGASRSRPSSWVTPHPDVALTNHREGSKPVAWSKPATGFVECAASLFRAGEVDRIWGMQADGWIYRVILALSGITLILVVVYLV